MSSKGKIQGAGTKLEDDELFKAIGGQLDADFDYSQWQRTEGGRNIQPTKTSKLKKETSSSLLASQLRVRSADHTCRHGHHKPVKKETVMERVDREKKEEQMKILKLRIQHRKQTITEYEKRRKQLLEENMKLKGEIEGVEKESHDKVKKLLRKYEKFRGGITTLNDNYMKELAEAEDDRDRTRVTIATELAALRREVNSLDKTLKEKQQELHILLNYKDKEYPVKSLRITELQKQIEDLKTSNMEEEQELLHMVETEIDKYKKSSFKAHFDLNENIMQKAVSMMHPSLKDMAQQNSVMTKEIEFHREEVKGLEEINKALEEEVKKLMKSPKTNLRQQLFPEFYPAREKCTPDMDVILDIPTQDWLPI